MVVGTCKITFVMYETNSLKEKRHIVKSVIERLKSRFNVSVAETDLNDKWQSAEIGVACVSNDKVVVDKTLNNVLNFIENDGRVEVTHCDMEIF